MNRATMWLPRCVMEILNIWSRLPCFDCFDPVTLSSTVARIADFTADWLLWCLVAVGALSRSSPIQIPLPA